MTKKRISGQMITIIILAILLLLSAIFGGVYAYYSTTSGRVSGKIYLSSLKIKFTGTSTDETTGTTQILLSNVANIVPNESLGNISALKIENLSDDVSIYIATIYVIDIEKCRIEGNHYISTGEKVDDDYSCPFIDVGAEYTYANGETLNINNPFIYYLYQPAENTSLKFHCLISKEPAEETVTTIIEEDALRLHRDVSGDKYMGTQIRFTFQAFAIAANSFEGDFTEETTQAEKNQIIMDAIFKTNQSEMEYLYNIYK